MFPKVDEQRRILEMEVPVLARALVRSSEGRGNLVVSAIYDLLRVGYPDKAKMLLLESISIIGAAKVAEAAKAIVSFRVHWDEASRGEQEPFLRLCCEAGLSVEITPAKSVNPALSIVKAMSKVAKYLPLGR